MIRALALLHWEEMPSCLTLHRLVSELRSRVTQLSQANEEGAGEQQLGQGTDVQIALPLRDTN